MLNFLKTFEQVETNRYNTQIRNTVVKFTLKSAVSMEDNIFHITNENIGALF